MIPPERDGAIVSRSGLEARMAGRDELRIVLLVGFWLALGSALLFSFVPQLDLAVSRFFLVGDNSFLLNDSPFWKGVRWLFLRGFLVWYVLVVIGIFLTAGERRAVFGLTHTKWVYLGTCSLAGPLLVTNVILKEEWGRWRPREVEQFGGTQGFTTPLDTGGTCLDNCSFVSGEVSSTVMLFLSVALVSRSGRPPLYLLCVAMTGLSAFIRIGQGGHFLSDTLFAAAFMIFVAVALYWLFFLGRRPFATEDSIDWQRISAAPDRFFAIVSQRGLAILDRFAPRK